MDYSPEEFRAKLIIDRHALDEAIAEQADLFYTVAERYALCRDQVENAKAELDGEDARLALAIRADAEKIGTKTTEGKIAEQVLASDVHTRIAAQLNRARLGADTWDALRDAFGQRASMLKLMADLYVSGYYSLTSTRSTGTKVAESDAVEGRSAMAARRKRFTK